MRVPDAIEPAVGYRAWLVRDNTLFSVVHTVEWKPDVPFEAFCNHEHEVPDPKCSCGTYATATFDRLFHMGYARQGGLFSVGPGDISIAGQVSLWGGIVPGQYGWRAQFAYPKKLLIPYTRARIAVALAERYGVPFKLYNLEREHPVLKKKGRKR